MSIGTTCVTDLSPKFKALWEIMDTLEIKAKGWGQVRLGGSALDLTGQLPLKAVTIQMSARGFISCAGQGVVM